MPQTNQDKRQVWGKYPVSPIYRAGNIQPSIGDGLNLLRRTAFSEAPLGQTTGFPEIAHYSEDLTKRAVVVDNRGVRVLRQNVNTRLAVDPISGQVGEGSFNHFFNCTRYANRLAHPNQTWKVTHRMDHSFWDCRPDENTRFPYPVADGKYFLQDITERQEGPYLGLKNFDNGDIALVSGNDGVANTVFAHVTSGGWTNRPYGWKSKSTGIALNSLTLRADSGYIFRTDGEIYSYTMEIRYNPGGLNYHKVRMRSSTGAIYRDLIHGNTDANGWMNFPDEWEYEGARMYSNGIAFGPERQDVTNAPGVYGGVCGGYEIISYEFWSGVAD
jgi:hypothetical protein